MTVKECILQGLGLLGLSRLVEKVENDTGGSEVEALFGMAKNVIEEICCDYYPLKMTQNVRFDAGKMQLTQLERTPVDIYWIKVGNMSYPFELNFDRIEAEIEGDAKLCYSFLPSIAGMNDELPFNHKITARMIGYGIAAEYCVVNGMLEGVTFDKKYRDSLRSAASSRKEKRIKRRIWA